MRQLKRLTRGSPELLQVLNDLVEAVNEINDIRGDNFITTHKGGNGTALSLNVNALLPFLAKGAGNTSVVDVHRLVVQENAPADENISCKKVDSNDAAIGSAFDVKCNLSGTTALNSTIRRLETGDFITAYKIEGTWHCTEGFQKSVDC